MTPDLLSRVRETFEGPEVVDAVARAIAEQGIRALDGGFRGMARDALAAIPATALAAVIAVVQEDRTRATLAILDGLAECSIDEWGEGYAAALRDVRGNVIHEFGGTTHDDRTAGQPMTDPSTPPSVDWKAVGPPASGLCTRCRRREASVVLRMFVQERNKGSAAGKTLAGRALRLCEPCGRDVFVYTVAQAERAAAALRDPDHAARDALRYAVSYLERDAAGKELCDALDIDYLRAAAGLDAA